MLFGVTSFGEPKKVFEKLNWKIAGREQVNVDSDHEDVVPTSGMSEDEAYDEIEERFEVVSVRMNYLPEETQFLEMAINEEIQNATLVYGNGKNAKISYFIRPNYRLGSFGKDVEDDCIEKYVEKNVSTDIYVKRYLVKNGESRWSVQFEYCETSYSLTIYDASKEEVDKILKGLFFP